MATLKTAADRIPTPPTTMRAAAIDRFGAPKVLTAHTLPVPQFGLHELGANSVIDARSADAAEQLDAVAPDGIDAVLALAGGEALEGLLQHVRKGGRVAYPNGVEPEPSRQRKFRVIAYDAEVSPAKFEELQSAVDKARLHVPIAATYPLPQAANAHMRLKRGHVLCRIALRIQRNG